ncbi:gallidermin/nisin family lantibiotic [Clostridium felsineum]|uniref:gallidermin/nisin family lantibiotic n=1 Tax=Clostridium felsineum TaxID=36839 RepID=UPI00098C0C88|nr:gallidermin/nisin family lantibiotic [Clostridium felsineum]URZ14284.1 hypothetical protein CLFE_002690 [Clostridium felsineum DSM 794]
MSSLSRIVNVNISYLYILKQIIIKGDIIIPKFDDFDLDVKINKGKGVKPQIATSAVACTPGSCWGCPETSTFASACCNVSDNCGD